MCGIFAFLTKNFQIRSASQRKKLEEVLDFAFMEGQNRGPEASSQVTSADYMGIQTVEDKETYWYSGFHRLAINGLTENGMQPFVKDGIVLICNGEIYNYEELYKEIGFDDMSLIGSDCQVIIDYYINYGIEYTISRLHGVFAFTIIDTNKRHMYVARDRIGIRALYWAHADAKPLYRNHPDYGRTYVFASELKQITAVAKMNSSNPVYSDSAPLLAEQFPPGHYASIDFLTGEYVMKQYWNPTEHVSYLPLFDSSKYSMNDCQTILVETLFDAVKRRVDACEREICCLLSGGLDSSLIASMVARILKTRGQKVKTFSIGMSGSEDLRCAQVVADFIGSEHTEIIVTNDEMFETIPEVVKAIETYDTTTIRASVGNYMVCRYIKNNCDAKVVFNGDGADEVMGGYLYFQAIKDYNTHCMERLRLISELSNYDVLRSDKSIAGNGLEARTPYLDPEFIRTYFAVADYYHKSTSKMTLVEKELIRNSLKSYEDKYKYLPDEVLFRRKEAFSDGVSGQTKSWKEEIEERIQLRGIDKRESVVGFVNSSDGKMTIEQAYYKDLFADAILRPHKLWFNDLNRVFYDRLETRWMPRYVKATDPSARTLDMYSQPETSNTKTE